MAIEVDGLRREAAEIAGSPFLERDIRSRLRRRGAG
jgi:hypothetical protein